MPVVAGILGFALLVAGDNPVRADERVAAEAHDIVIDGKEIYPESITSTAAGAVFTGSLKGIVFRALPGQTRATEWAHPESKDGQYAIFGVLADERSQTLWACWVPNPFQRTAAKPGPSALLAFDLASGKQKGTYTFPPPGGTCNDIAVAADGTAYASDTPNGRILALAPGAATLRVVGSDERLKGIDGLAFASDGQLYVTIVTRGALLRVELQKDGTLGELTELTLSQPIEGPDGFRPIGGNRFLLAENASGRIDVVTIDGNAATLRVLKEGLNSPPGVTLAGRTVYAVEGKIGYLIDPKLKGQDPGPFKAIAMPLR